MKNFVLLRSQQGFSLIEVMVAATILSISLIGFAQAQLLALQAAEHAYLINLANLKNIELAEGFKICRSRRFCFQPVLTLWKNEIQENFPKGMGLFSKCNLSNYQSKIQWFSSFSKFPLSLDLLFSA